MGNQEGNQARFRWSSGGVQAGSRLGALRWGSCRVKVGFIHGSREFLRGSFRVQVGLKSGGESGWVRSGGAHVGFR